jgi:iron complex transport system ATP-binding protein
MLHLRGASVRIATKTLLRSVTLALEPGAVLAVVGPNGAGKTTLLRLLSGAWTPTQGQVLLDERPLAAWAPEALARRRAVMPQHATLSFAFTTVDVVLMGRTPHRTGHELDLHVARAAMQAAGITHLAARSYPTLSGGEQQRVHLARALAQIWDPPDDFRTDRPAGNQPTATAPAAAPAAVPSGPSRYLLLDEPTASRDLAHQHQVLRTARRCAREGVGVLAVLHDLNLAAQYADRIVVLSGGRLVAAGAPAAVLTPEVILEAFSIPVLVTNHPCAACPLVVPMPHDGPAAAIPAATQAPPAHYAPLSSF